MVRRHKLGSGDVSGNHLSGASYRHGSMSLGGDVGRKKEESFDSEPERELEIEQGFLVLELQSRQGTDITTTNVLSLR